MLGRANYNLLDDAESSQFRPTTVLLLDKDQTQIEGTMVRLKNWASEDPTKELAVGGGFGMYRPPKFYGYKGVRFLCR